MRSLAGLCFDDDDDDAMQDYCGLLSEEAVRKNFVLLYELLDEVIDYGYPQNSSSEALKEFVLNEPTVLKSVSDMPCPVLHTCCRSDDHTFAAHAYGLQKAEVCEAVKREKRLRIEGPKVLAQFLMGEIVWCSALHYVLLSAHQAHPSYPG